MKRFELDLSLARCSTSYIRRSPFGMYSRDQKIMHHGGA